MKPFIIYLMTDLYNKVFEETLQEIASPNISTADTL
jgi:hypothetical protein